MKNIKLFFTFIVLLIAFSFILYGFRSISRTLDTLSTLISPLAYAQVVPCDGGVCRPDANACDANNEHPVAICDSSTGSMCCVANPPPPPCTSGAVCGSCWGVGTNTTCRPNNGNLTCTYTGPGTCIPVTFNEIGVCEIDSCTVPSWGCVGGTCVPYWTISGAINDVDGNGTPSIPVTCAGHGASGGAFFFGYGDQIRTGGYTCSISLPANYIATSATSRGVSVGPNATGVDFSVARVFSISGTITDVDGNGTPSIPVTCAGHGSSGGPFTFGYGLHIRRGGYTCSISLPANYIPIGATSQGVTVGPDKTGVDFNVARVFSISGNVIDDDGNGTPNIPVTCAGHSASGGPFTFGYGLHIRRGSYTCSIALPANYIPLGPTSIPVTVGPDATGVDFHVARVFSISGTITDVDGNGTPSIPVTCAGHSASGGPYTFGYGLHIRRGSYTCSIALPANYIAIGPTSIPVTVGPDATGIDFQVARVFSISGTVTDPYNGNAGVGGVQVSSGYTATTDGAGNYTIPYAAHLRRGAHTVTLTIPAGWTNTTVTSRSVTVGPDATGVDFGVTKLFSVSGNVFIDPNINQVKEFGEVNYTETASQLSYIATTLGISVFQPTPPTPFTSNDGTYTVNQLISGTFRMFFTPPAPPPRWFMTSPLNGPPPSFQVTVGYNCNVNGAPGAACNNGNITDLNFGMVDNLPWFQSTCGDIRNDKGISDPVPNNYYANITDASCTNPGISFTGDADSDFGDGQNSSTHQEVGGFSYPEVFSTTSPTDTSYASLYAKAQNAGITPVDMTTVCSGGSLTNCTLNPNLPHGVYLATGANNAPVTVTLNAYTFPNNQDYVFLINGNLILNGAISSPAGSNSTVIFSASGNITVNPAIGTAPNDPTTTLDGWYVAGGSLLLPSGGDCADLRLNIGGALVINAQGTGGTLQNDRNLCRFNAVDPTISVTQRLDMILNAPQFIKNQQTVSQELAP